MEIRLLYTIVGVGFVINVIVYVGFVGVLVFVGLIIVVAVLDAGLLVMLSFFIVTRFGIYTCDSEFCRSFLTSCKDN